MIRSTSAIIPSAIALASLACGGNGNLAFAQNPTSIVIQDAQVRLIHTIDVAAQADGLIERIETDEGQTVMPKQPIVKIDSRVAEAEVSVAKTEVKAAKDKAANTAEIEFAEASDAVAQENFGRQKLLLQRGVISDAEYRRAELEAVKTEKGVDAQRLRKAQDEMQVQVAEQKLKQAQVQLEMYTVLAPMEGLITERLRDQGEWIRAGEPVFRMVHLNEVKVEAKVAVYRGDGGGGSLTGQSGGYGGQTVASVSPSELKNAKMRITVHVAPDYKPQFESKVEFVDPVIVAGKVKVWSRIPNQRVGDGPWILQDGMLATVEIIVP